MVGWVEEGFSNIFHDGEQSLDLAEVEKNSTDATFLRDGPPSGPMDLEEGAFPIPSGVREEPTGGSS